MGIYWSQRRKKRLQRLALNSVQAPVATVDPSVTGTFTVGQTVTVSLGTWTDADSLAGSLRYVSDDTEIDTFTADGTYQLVDADFGEQLYLYVTATGAGGVASAESAATAAVGLPTTNLLAWWYGGNGNEPEPSVGVADGAAVTTWNDKTGTYSPTQGTAANRPVYRQSVAQLNGRGAVEADGANDYLQATISGPITTELTTFTRYIVFRSAYTLTQLYLSSEGNSASNSVIVGLHTEFVSGVSYLSYRHRNTGASGPYIFSTPPVNVNDGNVHLAVIRRTAAGAWTMYVDGVQVATSATTGSGTYNIDRFTMFALGQIGITAGSYLKGQIALHADYAADNRAVIDPILLSHYAIANGPRQAGVWTWYNDPRAIRVGDYTYLGYISDDGSAELRKFDHTTEVMTDRFTIKARLQVDDHDNPGFLVRASDNKLMAFYSLHIGGSIYMRIASNALPDISAWAAEVNLDSQLGLSTYSYANPVQLTDETNDPIYLFFRGDPGTGWAQYYSVSTDGGATWAAAVRWLEYGTKRPYLKLAQNGGGRIDFMMTDGHPDNEATSIYHGYYEGGNLYKSDGTLVGALSTGGWEPIDFTKVYDGATVRAWNWQIVIDGSGHPVMVYGAYPSSTDHRYRYARWNGSAWVDNQICTAGMRLYAGQPHYSGGVTIDPDDVNTVYASRDTGDGIHQIWKCVTADGGANWTLTQLTSGAYRCIRPYVVPGHGADYKLAYLRGRYTTYTDFDTEIRLIDG